jgi:hypothetical protein
MQHIIVHNHRKSTLSDPERPIIPIAIGPHIFQEAIYDFGASVNVMPKVIYDKINGDTLLYTNMHL